MNKVALILIALLISSVCHAQMFTAPPEKSITGLSVWTLCKPNLEKQYPGTFYICRDGSSVAAFGARGSKIASCNEKIYVYGRLRTWWLFTGATWQDTKLATLPCDPPSPVPIPFNLNWTLGPITKKQVVCQQSGETVTCTEDNTPTHFRIYREGVFIAEVAYPTMSYTDMVTGTPGKTTRCYEVSPVNKLIEGPRSNRPCLTK